MVAAAGTGPSAVALFGGAALMALAFSAGRFSATDLNSAATGPASGSVTIATVVGAAAQPLRPAPHLTVTDAPERRAAGGAGGAGGAAVVAVCARRGVGPHSWRRVARWRRRTASGT